MLISYKEELTRKCDNLGIYDLVSHVLEDPRFEIWSGSGSAKHHHYGDHGLIRHTKEVFDFVEAIYWTHKKMSNSSINIVELLVSVIWHDYGKIWDYQKDPNGVWGKHNDHARQIHHITRSALEFEKAYENRFHAIAAFTVNKSNILHNILSHHGSREWGSPVAPATKEAWILHLADNLSARLDDCDKHDILDH
jgi:3'-5' exoribonuclease